MKRIVLILVMAVVGLCGTVQAQTFRDRSGSYTGRIESDGTVRNRSGEYVGRIETSGTVRDRSGSYMGKFESGVQQCRVAAVLFFDLL